VYEFLVLGGVLTRLCSVDRTSSVSSFKLVVLVLSRDKIRELWLI